MRALPAALALLACAAAGAQEPPAALPESLPPLDESLVNGPTSPLRPFAQARLRGELDDSRDLSREDDASVGTALTGRIGLDAELDGAHLDVVVGDGARLGMPATAAALVARPALPALYQAELTFDLAVAGFPGALSLGRMPVVVADGRLVGTEPFDPRGRTLDGARLRAHAGGVDAGLGAFWLGPGTLDASDKGRAVSGLVVVEAGARPDDAVDLDVYALLHRDGVAGLTVPTTGLRLQAAWSILRGRAGADVQAPIEDGTNAFSPSGTAGHAEAGARATFDLRGLAEHAPDVFVDASGEVTAGAVVAGRVFRAPAPTQHGVLGLLDFVAADNTWSSALMVGADDGAARVDVAGRLIGIVDRNGPLLHTDGSDVAQRTGNGLAVVELDCELALPLTSDLALGVGYGIGLPGSALVGDEPVQRFLVTLTANVAPGLDARGLPSLE